MIDMPLTPDKPLSIAIMATGGQGGGVLADWIVELAEREGWAAQSTSVPGVAQRTGATIYYIELMKPQLHRHPVFSLMPTPGDVDVVLAAELMEAGRAILRGLVRPSRTTLIVSTHRSLAVVEKVVPGNGIADPLAVAAAAEQAARRVIGFDMNELAQNTGSMISAVMFGALAAAEVLPFSRGAFEQAIRSGGKGIDASLEAFAAAYEKTCRSAAHSLPSDTEKATDTPLGTTPNRQLNQLIDRVRGHVAEAAQAMVFAGVRRLVDYQDVAYAHEYLDRIAELHALDVGAGGGQRHFAFTTQAAKYVAVAMAYDDIIRVADLKTRASRFARIRRELDLKQGPVVRTTEYMHPRLEEVLSVLPPAVGRFLDRRPRVRGALARRIDKGRRLRTDTLSGFLLLYTIGQARFLRRRSARHHQERAHLESWLAAARECLPKNYGLAVEILACRRLVKGYSDTHARGLAKFDRVMEAVPKLVATPNAAASLRHLREMALKEESQVSLDTAIREIHGSLAG